MADPTNDYREPSTAISLRRPDPHGEAALLLVESLIHGLLARSGLSVPEAVQIVQTAIDVRVGIGEERGDDLAVDTLSRTLLTTIANSLKVDLSEEDGAGLDPGESFDGEII